MNIAELGKSAENGEKILETNVCSRLQLPMTVDVKNGEKYYNTSFFMKVYTKQEEGLYNFYFHSCPNYKNDDVFVDFTVSDEDIIQNSFI